MLIASMVIWIQQHLSSQRIARFCVNSAGCTARELQLFCEHAALEASSYGGSKPERWHSSELVLFLILQMQSGRHASD